MNSGWSPGITNCPGEPVPLPGEDVVSYERHIKALQVEYKKSRQNKHIVCDLAERSFAMRRKEIVDKHLHLESIFDRFPFLQETEEVRNIS